MGRLTDKIHCGRFIESGFYPHRAGKQIQSLSAFAFVLRQGDSLLLHTN